MKRRVTKLILFLLLGAIINVAVAFALGRWGSHPTVSINNLGQETRLGSREITLWYAHAPPEWGDPPSTGMLHMLPGKRYVEIVRLTNPFDPTDLSSQEVMAKRREQKMFVVWILDCGWPRLCIGAESWFDGKGIQVNPTQYSGASFGGIRLPSHVIWPGFAINTIFYAAIISGGWLPFAAFGRIRRRRRTKRGHCVRCGYDLRGRGNSGGGTCPECGAAAIAMMPNSRKPTAESPP